MFGFIVSVDKPLPHVWFVKRWGIEGKFAPAKLFEPAQLKEENQRTVDKRPCTSPLIVYIACKARRCPGWGRLVWDHSLTTQIVSSATLARQS